MSELEKSAGAGYKEYRTNLYEILVGEDSWVVLSNSYGEVARYVDLVFRLKDLPALKIRKLELCFRVVMDMDPGESSMMTPLYLATVREDETDTESKLLSNSISALLSAVNEADIVSISLYSPRAVVLADVEVINV